MIGLPCRCNTAGGAKGPEGRPWSCPGLEQTWGQSPLGKLSTGQKLSWQFWEVLPEETDLTKSLKNTDVIATKAWSGFMFDEGSRRVLGEATWVMPTLHPPLWGTNQAHLSRGLGHGGWEEHTAASRACRHYSAADFLLFLSFPKQLFEGRSWEQLKLAVRDQPHPPTHSKSGNHHAIRLF